MLGSQEVAKWRKLLLQCRLRLDKAASRQVQLSLKTQDSQYLTVEQSSRVSDGSL